MRIFLLVLAVAIQTATCAQKASNVIDVKEVERVETTLSANEMQGRKAGTPGIEKAAAFIAAEFTRAGLQPLKAGSFLQSFVMLRSRLTTLKGDMDGAEMDTKNIVIVTAEPEVKVNEKSGYQVLQINAGENVFEKAQEINGAGKNAVVYVDTSFAKNFSRLTFLKRQIFRNNPTIVFVLGKPATKEFTIKAEHSFTETSFANVVGMLPGKTKPNEYVIFSAHYDHLGIGKPVDGDSIYNGANDDAAGTTAVVMLADYFKKQNNNERSIIFAAFTAEEMGGYGSKYFSQQLKPTEVVAMFNIEMIGTESKWGKNSAYITGFDKTNMGEILQRNLAGSAFTFHPDPYPDQNLFYRSDNATLAALGVPAHTISTSKMDSEPNYHKV
ncbi:MAG: M28 family peptidase, partial [Bacteroidota bacterium]